MGQAHFEETIRSLEQYMEFRGMALGLREVRACALETMHDWDLPTYLVVVRAPFRLCLPP